MGDRQWGIVTLHTTFLFFYIISDLFLIYFRTLASPASLVGSAPALSLPFLIHLFHLLIHLVIYFHSIHTCTLSVNPQFVDQLDTWPILLSLLPLSHSPLSPTPWRLRPGGPYTTIRSFHSIHQHFATNPPDLEQYLTGNNKQVDYLVAS